MSFTEGKQPCDNFEPPEWEIGEHECFCKNKDGEYCRGKVMFCENCGKDHHSNGYQTCEKDCNCKMCNPKIPNPTN